MFTLWDTCATCRLAIVCSIFFCTSTSVDQNDLIFRKEKDAQTCKRGRKDKIVNLSYSFYSQGNSSQLFYICCTPAVLQGISLLNGITFGIDQHGGLTLAYLRSLDIINYHSNDKTCQKILNFSFIAKPEVLILIERFTWCNFQLAIQIDSKKFPNCVWV